MATRRQGKRVATPEGVRVLNKNANRDGSVYRQANGRWCATWWVPGETRPRKATGKTQQAAIDRRARRQAEAGHDPDAVRNLGKLSDWWLHNVHKQAVRASSWAKAEDRVRRIKSTLGDLDVADLNYRVVTEWQAKLALVPLAPRTVRHHRQTLAQIVDEAVKMGLLVGNPVRSVKPPKVADYEGVALEREEVAKLLAAVRDHRLGAAVVLLFLQGWRVSEVLGLAWEDVDLETGLADLRRASVYVDGKGQMLGPPKTDGARGEHWLMPTVIELLRRSKEIQAVEQVAAPVWEEHTYEGELLHLVFTTPSGGLVLRQTVAKVVKQAAKTAGIADNFAPTHTGRRSVITSLWDEGDIALEDIAQFVGHAKAATTAIYVKRRKRRPREVSKRAAELLDVPPPGNEETPPEQAD